MTTQDRPERVELPGGWFFSLGGHQNGRHWYVMVSPAGAAGCDEYTEDEVRAFAAAMSTPEPSAAVRRAVASLCELIDVVEEDHHYLGPVDRAREALAALSTPAQQSDDAELPMVYVPPQGPAVDAWNARKEHDEATERRLRREEGLGAAPISDEVDVSRNIDRDTAMELFAAFRQISEILGSDRLLYGSELVEAVREALISRRSVPMADAVPIVAEVIWEGFCERMGGPWSPRGGSVAHDLCVNAAKEALRRIAPPPPSDQEPKP